MKTEQEYINDLSEIRSMMERSTKFLSLSGFSGVMAGIYALLGAIVIYWLFNLDFIITTNYAVTIPAEDLLPIILIAVSVLLLAVGTAAFLSYKKARRNNEKVWNPVAKKLALNMAIPLFTGGIFILIFISKGLFAFVAPLTLIFYGLALINASKFTFGELRSLGIAQIILGLISAYFPALGLLFWAIGFGLMHIAYGIYMHLKYEK
ncbi:hypothetical protein [Salinimicrobium sp. GXAS 041]|uniref:hypothetical protein n=1 Tax=Salinimicrobium sp. GXAS 041 TaxID=3400806 RepID=UPI003C780D2E